MDKDRLKRRQLDSKLGSWRSAVRHTTLPSKGWIREIRRALGMSARQLGRRMGVSQSAVAQYEKAEIEDRITLGTLREVAHALECDLVYALLPRVALEEMRRRQARRRATELVGRAAHSMSLERQEVSEEATAQQVDDLAQELLTKNTRLLWEEP